MSAVVAADLFLEAATDRDAYLADTVRVAVNQFRAVLAKHPTWPVQAAAWEVARSYSHHDADVLQAVVRALEVAAAEAMHAHLEEATR